MKKKRKLKKKVVILIILIAVLVIAVGGFLLCKFVFLKEENHAKVINEIPEYGYTLEADQPEVYKNLFEKLAKVLSAEEVDEEEYARLVAQMLAIDFYNLENKVSKNDVGGTEFIKENYIDNFVLEASDTVYKYIEQNIYGDRKQELPEVVGSSVNELKTGSYSYANTTDDSAYRVTVNLEYKKDLGYPTEVVVKFLHNGKRLEAYQMS